jgi:hypothetical protein
MKGLCYILLSGLGTWNDPVLQYSENWTAVRIARRISQWQTSYSIEELWYFYNFKHPPIPDVSCFAQSSIVA